MELATGQRTWEHLLAGYMRNHNHIPGFLIPASVQQRSATTAFIEAPFIQWSTCNPLVVEGTTNGLLVYTAPLHATPHNPECEVNSLPPWLLSLLHPSSPHYNLIVQHANHEGDWGLSGELAQYHQFSLHITRVREHLNRWETELETLMGGGIGADSVWSKHKQGSNFKRCRPSLWVYGQGIPCPAHPSPIVF